MKREIKFRAWNTVNKQMYLPDTTDWDELHILLNGETQSAQQSGYYQTVSVFNRDDIELMQFTGMKDKNGIYIYEGDVLKGELICANSPKGSLPTMGVVEYDESYGSFGIINDAGHTLFYNHIHSTLEIIGNIYTHPHLLNTIINQPK